MFKNTSCQVDLTDLTNYFLTNKGPKAIMKHHEVQTEPVVLGS